MDGTLAPAHAPTPLQADASSDRTRSDQGSKIGASQAELAVAAPEIPVGDRPYLFSAEQFLGMVEAHVFPRESRVELWDGRVYEKMAKARAHCLASALFIEALTAIKPQGWYLNAEESVNLDPQKVPLPDILLIRGRPRDYADAHPTGRDIGLLVELSYSSLKEDTGPKLGGYARGGVPQYWVANLMDNVLHVHRDPIPEEARYATVEAYRAGEHVPMFLDGVEVARIATSDLLP